MQSPPQCDNAAIQAKLFMTCVNVERAGQGLLNWFPLKVMPYEIIFALAVARVYRLKSSAFNPRRFPQYLLTDLR